MNRTSKTIWSEPREELFRIGVDPGFIETTLGDWVGIELQPLGSKVASGDTFSSIITSSHTYDLKAAFDFSIVSHNEAAIADPRIVRQSPMFAGWLIEVAALGSKSS